MRYWHARLAMLVDSDADDDDVSLVAPPVGFRQSGLSGGVACGTAMRNASAQVDDWQYHSNQQLENEISLFVHQHIPIGCTYLDTVAAS